MDAIGIIPELIIGALLLVVAVAWVFLPFIIVRKANDVIAILQSHGKTLELMRHELAKQSKKSAADVQRSESTLETLDS